MAAPPKNTQLNREDLKDAPAWVEKLLEAFNPLMRSSSSALSRGLTFKENFLAEVKDITFIAPDVTWRSPTLTSGWVNHGGTHLPMGFTVNPGGRVFMRGTADPGTFGAGNPALTLPVGFRPSGTGRYASACPSAGGEIHVTILVQASGAVTVIGPNTATEVHFNNISFQADDPALPDVPSATGWPLSINHSLPEVSGVIPVMCRAEGVLTSQSNAAPTLDWEVVSSGIVKLKAVWGLTPGRRYSMRLLLFAR